MESSLPTIPLTHFQLPLKFEVFVSLKAIEILVSGNKMYY